MNSNNNQTVPSTKPYLIRALYQWCIDNGFTPYLAVFVDHHVQVPMEFVTKNEIVLNIGPTACQNLHIDNEWISFKARFQGIPKEILVPVTHVSAIYSRENSQGMSFPVNLPEDPTPKPPTEKAPKEDSASKPFLKLVK